MNILTISFLALLAASPFLNAQEKPPSPPPVSQTTPKSAAASEAGSPAKWLHGKWVFNDELTQKKYAEAKKPDGLDALKDALVFPQLLEKLKGSRLNITEKEVIMTTRDGNGKAYAYEFLEAPDSNSVTLKQTDGEVITYHKEGDGFWITSTGNVNIPFYFKRAE